MGKILIYAIGLVLALLFLGACNDAGCLDNRTSVPLIRFYNKNKPTEQLSIDSISVRGIGQVRDSFLLDSVSKISQLKLPLRDGVDSTQYIIRYNWRTNINHRLDDTLTFYYQSYPYFASLDCGCMFNYTLDSIKFTYHFFDSIAVVKPLIDNQNAENIQLFYPVSATAQ